MEILIKNQFPNFHLPVEKIKTWIGQVITALAVNADEISLVFTTGRQIQEYNRKYRGKDQETDVLSFPLGKKNLEGKINLGDIIISIDTARRQAEEYGHSLEEEVKILIIHGVLHLLNYDHEVDNGEMRKKEQELLDKL